MQLAHDSRALIPTSLLVTPIERGLVGFETNFYFLAKPWAETEAGGEADEDQLAPRAPMTPPQTHDDTLDTSVKENGSSW